MIDLWSKSDYPTTVVRYYITLIGVVYTILTSNICFVCRRRKALQECQKPAEKSEKCWTKCQRLKIISFLQHYQQLYNVKLHELLISA